MTDKAPLPHLDNWYRTSSPGPIYPVLQGETSADVCVVGGGIAGCSAALHLAERGYRVVLIEADRIGSGASGRSGGQCLPGVSCGQNALESLMGADGARLAWDLTREGLELQQALIARHGIDCDWRSGHLQVCTHARHERELRAEMEHLQTRYDYSSIEWIPRDHLAQHLRSDAYISGALDHQAGHLHPLKYTQGLARAAAAAGVTVYETSPAQNRLRSSTGWRVVTPQGHIQCKDIVLAGNATLGRFEPSLSRKILGAGTYMIATESLGAERAAQLLPTDVAVADMNWILDYFRLSADHRLLFGGEVSYTGLDASRYAPTLARHLLRVFPQLRDVPITHRWGGWIDLTVNRAPHFGRLEDGVCFVQGFSGHGLVLAGLAGKLIAEALQGSLERFDVFARIPHQSFPGGPWLRRPALALAMGWYRLRDAL